MMRSSGTAVLRSLASLVACETSSSAGPCSLPTIHQLHRHLSYEADTPTIGRNRRRPRAVSDVRLSSAGDNLSPFPGLPEPDQEFLESATPLELDLAARNAPTKTLQLIGDPRTGVADDTTQPLGSGVSVQPIYLNEATNVQWYRYTMNGERLNQCHRDGRLSDHSKNLMYILRAKDPVRWTIPELAKKFRIRRQRVLAILAIKEMEAQAIEAGKGFSGAMASYAFPVHLAHVRLCPKTGEPLDWSEAEAQQERVMSGSFTSSSGSEGGLAGMGRRKGKAGSSTLGSLEEFTYGGLAAREPSAPSSHLNLQETLPGVQYGAQALQLALLQLLEPYDYCFDIFKGRMLGQLERAEAFYQQHFAAGAGGEGQEGAEGEVQQQQEEGQAGQAAPLVNFPRYRRALQGLLIALEPFLDTQACPGLKSQVELVSVTKGMRRKIAAALGRGEQEEQEEQAAEQQEQQAAEAEAEGEAAAGQQQQQGELSAVDKLQRFTSSMSLHTLAASMAQLSSEDRAALLELVPGLQERIAAHEQASSGSVAASSSTHCTGVPLLDMWQYAPYSNEQVKHLLKAVQRVETAREAVQQLLLPQDQQQQAQQAAGSSKAASEGEEPDEVPATAELAAIKALRGQLRQYSLLEQLWGVVQREGDDEVQAEQAGKGSATPLSLEEKERMVQVLTRADPGNVEMLGFWELYHKHLGTSPRVAQQHLAKIYAVRDKTPSNHRRLAGLSHELGTWAQHMSNEEKVAFLDRYVVGRIYHRGSGEHHQVALPSYPHFEGHSLELLDTCEEGELSALERLQAEREDDAMWKDFREKLLANLGLVGEELWHTQGHARPQRPKDGWSLVVHSQGPRHQRRPTYVAMPDGRQRTLTDSEAFLERLRTRKRNAKFMPT